jgi:hypothetical protein
MPQDQESGRRAAKWGLETAAAIAAILGAAKVRKGSNECIFEGRRVVIKCAHIGNLYVGVLSEMLERVEMIIGAFERTDGAFDLRTLSRDEYRGLMRPSKSLSHVPNRGQQVRRADFETYGRFLRTVRT